MGSVMIKDYKPPISLYVTHPYYSEPLKEEPLDLPTQIACWVFATFFIGFIIFVACWMIGTTKNFGDEAERKKAMYIKENCEIAGWYGKHGEYTYYRCEGILVRDIEIRRLIK